MEGEASGLCQDAPAAADEKGSNLEKLGLLMKQESAVQMFRSQHREVESILSYECLSWLIQLIVTVGPEEDSERSCRLPFVASDVLCVDVKSFNEWLFAGYEERPPLFGSFLQFLQGPANYILAGYFSKILVSVIKRFHSVQTRYNEKLCGWVFAAETLNGLISHLYSRSMVEPILKLFTLKAKEIDYSQEKVRFTMQLIDLLETGGAEEWTGDNIAQIFSSLVFNEFSQKINYEVAALTFSSEVVDRIFTGLGNSNTIRKGKSKVAAIYLKQLKAIRENKLADQRQAEIIENGLGRRQELLGSYAVEILQEIRREVQSKEKSGAHTLALLESLYLLIVVPKLIGEETQEMVCQHLPHVLELIRQNPLNNILHSLVVRIVKQLGVHFKHKPQRMLVYMNVLVGVLLTFNEIIDEEHRKKVAYTGCLLNLSEFLLSAMETYKYEKSEEWAVYELAICKLLAEISELKVGAYTIKPQLLPLVYGRSVISYLMQAIAGTFRQFLRQDPIIEYEESRAQKEQHFDELKEKKLEELILAHRTDVQTAKFEVEEEFELYRYWKEGSRMKFDLHQLMSDI